MIIDKDLETAPLRDIFEQAKTHLLTQMAKSQSTEAGDRRDSAGGPIKMCMYRSPDGLKCAAGIFLSDDVANRNESDSIRSVVAGEGWDLPAPTRTLLTHLQNIHDTFPVDSWAMHLDTLEANTFLREAAP